MKLKSTQGYEIKKKNSIKSKYISFQPQFMIYVNSNDCSDIYNDVSFSKPHARASGEWGSIHDINVEPDAEK